MHIKKFRAANMTEALGLVKTEFGPDAVILSAVTIKNNRTLFGKGRSGVEVTAARENQQTYGAKDPSQNTGQRRPARAQGENKMARKPVTYDRIVKPFQRKSGTGNLAEMTHRPQHIPARPSIRDLFAVYRQMLDQGVAESIALDIAAGLSQLKPAGQPLNPKALKGLLVEIFDQFGIVGEPIKFVKGKGKIIALVGPTGVGKTTTAAKIAAIARYRKSEKRVALLTMDNHRVGGAAQLEKYAEIIGVPFQFVSNRKDLMQALQNLKNMDLVLIDTPGVGRRNSNLLEELRVVLSKVRNLETLLLLSATTKEDVMADVMDQFCVMPNTRLVITKVDESKTCGSVLNRLVQSKMPVAYLSTGQQVPEDIETATQEKIVDLLLNGQGKASDVWSKPPELLAMEIEKFRTRLIDAKPDEEDDTAYPSFYDGSQDIFGDAGEERLAGVR